MRFNMQQMPYMPYYAFDIGIERNLSMLHEKQITLKFF